jgi:aerobic carbon-monoxide dehydrogenase large subunit
VKERVVGSNVARLEDPALLKGEGRFVDDIHLPGTLHVAFVRSAFAHATLDSIDKSAAMGMPGVRAVWTMEDVAPHLRKTLINVALPSPAYRQELHRPILAHTETVYVGEPIAVVVAESRYLAEDAAALISIEYEDLPAVVDCRDALAPEAPRAHRDAPHNVAAEFEMGYGDVEAAFATAPFVFRESFLQHRGGAHPMECRGALAWMNPTDNVLTAWISTQTPHQAKRVLCDLLRFDEDRLRVITPDVGGGFGPKLVFYPEEALVALAALLLERPVKWIEDRKEHFVATTQERDQYWDVEIATNEDGGILGLRGLLIHDHGAYTARGVNVPFGSAAALTLPYIVPAYFLDVKLAVTNKVPVTPVRGAGQPQAVFAMERLLDRVARELNLDRAEVRRRNLVPAASIPYRTALRTRGGMQVVLDSGDYPACMALALDRAGWSNFPDRKAVARKNGRLIGQGLANYVEGTGRGPFEPVRVRIAENGRIHVASGASAMGQSTRTMLAQIVAEQLGGDIYNISVSTGDTGSIELGLGGFNSRQTVMAGSSAHAAAIKVRKKTLLVASHMLEVGEQALDIVGQWVELRGDPSTRIELAEVARAVAGLPGYFLPGNVEPGLEATERVVINEMAYGNGTCVCEVEVDAETGEVRVSRVVFAHDCGKAVHPKIVEGQVIGGIAHGLGNALFERMCFDENGQPVSTTLAEYLLVTATEMPTRIDIVHADAPSSLNELGVKGVGESGVIPMAAAIASAIDDALSSFGVFVLKTPVSPADIVELLNP